MAHCELNPHVHSSRESNLSSINQGRSSRTSRYNALPSHFDTVGGYRTGRAPHARVTGSFLSPVAAGSLGGPSTSSYTLKADQLTEPLYRSHSHARVRPPAPSVENVATALAQEHLSLLSTLEDELESRGPPESRGSVSQEALVEQILNLDTRFVLVSDAASGAASNDKDQSHAIKEQVRQRKQNASASQHVPRLDPEMSPAATDPVSALSSHQNHERTRAEAIHASSTRSFPDEKSRTARTASVHLYELPHRGQATYSVLAGDGNLDQLADDARHGARRSRSRSRSRRLTCPTTNHHLPRARSSQLDPRTLSDSPSLLKSASRASSRMSAPVLAAVIDKIGSRRSPVPGSRTASTLSSRRDVHSDCHQYTVSSRPITPRSSFDRPATPRGSAPQRGDHLDENGWTTSMHLADSMKPNCPIKATSRTRLKSDLHDACPPNHGGISRTVPQLHHHFMQAGAPYPVTQDFVAMPSEQFFLDRNRSASSAARRRSISLTSNVSTNSSDGRPVVTKDQCTHQVATSDGMDYFLVESAYQSLAPCPRRDSTNKHEDWYALKSFPQFNVCPSCLDTILSPTTFRREFVPARRSSLTVLTRCEFANPWVRIAWLLTTRRNRRDFGLVAGLPAIWELEKDCPVAERSTGPWWGLLDADLCFVPNFRICSRDKANIEHLFPALSKAFTQIPCTFSRKPHSCSLQVGRARFALYVNLMHSLNSHAESRYIHELATSSSWDLRVNKISASANTWHLYELARRLGRQPECPRDRIGTGTDWHCVFGHPDITVCPDCYDDIIRPDSKYAPRMVNLFTAVAKPSGHMNEMAKSSAARPLDLKSMTCQLYSARMRACWNRAAERDDAGYFIQKLVQRRKMEVHLRSQKTDLERLHSRGVPGTYSDASINRDMVRNDIDRINNIWQDCQ